MGWGTSSGRPPSAAQTLANAVRLYLASPTTGRRDALEAALNAYEATS